MNRKLALIAALLMVFSIACGTINKATPAGLDSAAIEADVRLKIAAVVPEKTFAIEVGVDGEVVTLDGHAASNSDIEKILEAARSVDGVKRVINKLHVQ